MCTVIGTPKKCGLQACTASSGTAGSPACAHLPWEMWMLPTLLPLMQMTLRQHHVRSHRYTWGVRPYLLQPKLSVHWLACRQGSFSLWPGQRRWCHQRVFWQRQTRFWLMLFPLQNLCPLCKRLCFFDTSFQADSSLPVFQLLFNPADGIHPLCRAQTTVVSRPFANWERPNKYSVWRYWDKTSHQPYLCLQLWQKQVWEVLPGLLT